MGIYVKGLKMPKSCTHTSCPIMGWACVLWKEMGGEEMKTKRHDNCPIVEVPDHGDLIERDAVAYKVCEEIPCSECQFNDYPNDSCVLQTNLEKLKVFIPADKEEA